MPYDNMGQFRQLGKDIGDMFRVPAELEYKVSEIQKEDRQAQSKLDYIRGVDQEEKTYKRAELEKKQTARAKAAEGLRAKYGDAAADAYLAGDPLSSIAGLRKADADFLRAKQGKTGRQRAMTPEEKFGKSFKGLQMIDQQLNNFIGKNAQSSIDSDNPIDIDQFNQLTSKIESEVAPDFLILKKAISTDPTNEFSNRISSFSNNLSKKLAPMDPLDYEEVRNVVSKKVGKWTGESQAYLDKLDYYASKYGVENDNDIYSTADIQAMVTAAFLKKELTKEDIQKMFNGDQSIDEYKKMLVNTLSPESKASEIKKTIAKAMLGNIAAMDTLGMDKELSSKISGTEYANLAYPKANVTDDMRQAGKKGMMKRRKKRQGMFATGE